MCFKRRGPYLSSPAYIFQKHSGHNQKLFSIHLPETFGTQPKKSSSFYLSETLGIHPQNSPVFFFQKYSESIKKLHGISPCISFRNIRHQFLESLLHLSLRRSQQKKQSKNKHKTPMNSNMKPLQEV